MINGFYVECLSRKILNGETNPDTNKPFCLEDIKIEEYKVEVEKLLSKEVVENGTK